MSDGEILQALFFIEHSKTIEDLKSYDAENKNELFVEEYLLLPLSVRNFSHPLPLSHLLRLEMEFLTNGTEYLNLKAAIEAKKVEVMEVLIDSQVQYGEKGHQFGRVYIDDANDVLKHSFWNVEVCQESLSSKRGFKWTTDADTLAVLGEYLLSGVDIPFRHAEGGFLLHLAARRDDVALATLLLDKGADIHGKTNAGRTALNVAADCGSSGMVALLLQRGANVDARECNGSTPLHAAAKKGHVESCKTLLQHGANVNATISATLIRGATALHLAIDGGYPEVVELLVSNGADVHASNYFQINSLQFAVQKGSAQMVRSILNHGANMCDPKNKAAFLAAVRGDSVEWKSIVEAMLEHGFLFSAENACDSRLLHGAVRQNYLPVVEKLLELGADVNAMLSAYKSRKAPLHVAAEYASDDVIALFLQNGAEINVECHLGRTPLFYAAEAGRLSAADLLIKAGANLKAKDYRSETALSVTCLHDQPEMAKLLLKNGADVNEKSPIVVASRLGFFKVVKVLCQFGAQLNAKELNRTALHEAAKFGFCDVVKVLIEYGADINIQGDLDERTPLFDAVAEGKIDVVRALLAFGARLGIVNRDNKTALQVAAEGQYEMFELLLEYRFTDMDIFEDSVVNSAFRHHRVKDNESIVILRNHMNKVTTAGFNINQVYLYLGWCSWQTFARKKTHVPCIREDAFQKEILDLKNTYVGTTQISLYDILLMNEQEIAYHLRNTSFSQSLKSEYKSVFPIYGMIIDHNIQKGHQRLELISNSEIISLNLFGRFGTLPVELVEMILSHLDNREILVLRGVCGGAE